MHQSNIELGINNSSYELSQIKQREMLKNARRAHLARAAQSRRNSFLQTILRWTGNRLLATGHYLIARVENNNTDCVSNLSTRYQINN